MSHVDDGQLNALLDGELPAAEARAVESHVATCADCRRRLEEARSFLQEANSLLETLSPGAAAPAPALPEGPRAQEPARPSRQSVPVRPVGSLADLPGGEGGSARPPAPPAPTPPLAPAATAPPAPGRKVPKTMREIAVDIDGRTGMAPGISPVFTDEPRSAASLEHARPRRGLDLEKLAWAANIVLALGVGFLANEVRWMHSERQPPPGRQGSVVETVTVRAPASPAQIAANRADRPARPSVTGSASRGFRPTGGARHGAATPITKSPNARGPKVTPGVARPAPAGDLATRRPRAPDAFASAEQQAPRNAPSAAAQGAGLAGGAQPPRRAPGLTATPAARQRANALDEAGPRPTPGFTRITMEEAVRTLSSSIRQIDGMTPLSIEAGGGRLVPGSDASREVVRVNYTDQYGRRFTLDQQLAEPRAGRAFNGIIPGDTLVAPTADGGSRVRWLDGKFWLSLSGPVPAGEIRALVGRVR